MKIFAITLVIFTLGSVCSGSGRKGGLPRQGPVPHMVILSGTQSSADSFEVILITNNDQWQKTWKIANGTVEPLPSMPEVDFKKSNVIAAFMGARNSSGYKIEISSIEKAGSSLMVHVKKYETPGMLPVVTRPYTLVKIPKGDYKIEVTEESVQ